MEQVFNPKWAIGKRFFWRFIGLYIVFYIFPYGFEYIHEINTADSPIWHSITIWFGEQVFGWEFNKDRLLNGFDSKFDFARFALV